MYDNNNNHTIFKAPLYLLLKDMETWIQLVETNTIIMFHKRISEKF